MMMGNADEIVTALGKDPVFMEDLPEQEQAVAVDSPKDMVDKTLSINWSQNECAPSDHRSGSSSCESVSAPRTCRYWFQIAAMPYPDIKAMCEQLSNACLRKHRLISVLHLEITDLHARSAELELHFWVLLALLMPHFTHDLAQVTNDIGRNEEEVC